jgi:hypothetical protein
MNNGSTLFLKSMLVLLGLAVALLCIFVLPSGIRHTTNWYGYRPMLLAVYIPAIPFYLGLFHGFRLLQAIDNNNSVFADSSIKSLGIIKYCGIAIGSFYTIALPYIFYLAQMDDAPGVMLIGLVFAFAPLGIALVAAIVQKQLQTTIAIKSENDLTV